MAFDPVTLFAGSEEGVIYDVQILSSMWQDSAGTTPAVVDSPVGRINDLSGNGHHAVQATAGSRPMLRYSAIRGYYLQSDGIDDKLQADFAFSLPFTRVTMMEQLSWGSVDMMYRSANGRGQLRQFGGGGPELEINDGVGACGTQRLRMNTPGLVTEIHNGASSSLRINQDTPTTGDPGSNAPDGISIFASADATLAIEARLGGVVMIDRVLTATEIENTQAWLTERYPRVVVVDGDSNSFNDNSYGRQFIPNANPFAFVQVIAYGGTGLNSNIPNDLETPARVASIDARIPADKRGRQYVYFPWWSNNMPDTVAEVVAFFQARKAAGWDKVGIGTLVERTDSGQDNTATRAGYNAIISAPGWIAANGIDFLVDFAADPTIGVVGMSTDTNLCSDLVHLTTLCHTYAEAVFRAAVNAIPLPTPAEGWIVTWSPVGVVRL